MQTYLTADTHFGHKNSVKYRPFDTVEDMDASIISNWNTTVSQKDVVYILGDFVWGGYAKVKSYLKQLNGNIYIIKGNHDNINHLNRAFTEVQGKDRVFRYLDRKIDGQHVFMSHFAMLTWDKSHYGSYCACGHSHGRLPQIRPDYIPSVVGMGGGSALICDVGVDVWNYTPVSFEEFCGVMENKKVGI